MDHDGFHVVQVADAGRDLPKLRDVDRECVVLSLSSPLTNATRSARMSCR